MKRRNQRNDLIEQILPVVITSDVRALVCDGGKELRLRMFVEESGGEQDDWIPEPGCHGSGNVIRAEQCGRSNRKSLFRPVPHCYVLLFYWHRASFGDEGGCAANLHAQPDREKQESGNIEPRDQVNRGWFKNDV